MKFTLSAQLSPSGPFGVPQDKYVVVPTGTGREIYSPAVDTLLAKVVGHGSMSIYRRDDEAIRETLKVDEFTIRFSDNYVFIEVESHNGQNALSRCLEFLERFLIQLSVHLRRPFSYDILGLTDEQNRRYLATPETISLTTVTTYNLDDLRQAIHAAAEASSALDDRMNRASQYFEHALFLYEKRQELAQPGTRHYSALISSVFLSLAKAVTILVGDPSSDHDHQRRYKDIGLDYDFYKNKIGRVLELRNSYDVAHHDLTGRGADVIEQNYGEAVETTSTILACYSEHLKNKQ
jgi:hypothetical protein